MLLGFTNSSVVDQDSIFKNLGSEESYLRERANILGFDRPHLCIMSSIYILHNVMSWLIAFYQTKNIHLEDKNMLVELIDIFDEMLTKNQVRDVLISHDALSQAIFSEEVELFKEAFHYAKTTQDVESFNSLVQFAYKDWIELKINPKVSKMLKYIETSLGAFKDRVRVRRQKSKRNAKTVSDFIGGINIHNEQLYCYRFDFFMSENKFHDIYAANQKKEIFLKLMRNTINNGNLRYIWFLEFNLFIGYTIHFIFLCGSQLCFDPTTITKLWESVAGVAHPQLFCQYSSADLVDQRLQHRCYFNTNNLLSSIYYICFKELYYKGNCSTGLNTFGKGTFGSKSKMSFQKGDRSNMTLGSNTLNQNTSPLLMAQPHSLENGCKMFNYYSQPNDFKIKLCKFKEVYWSPEKATNPFLLITGLSGSGKSNSLTHIAMKSSEFLPVWVFDPHNKMEIDFERILFSSGTESTLGVNPLAIYADDFSYKGLPDHIQTIIDTIKRATKSLSLKQSGILREVLDFLYNEFYSLADNSQIPTFDKVIEILSDWAKQPDKKSQKTIIEGCLASIKSTFQNPVFNRKDNFDIQGGLKKNLYFDISNLASSERFILIESLLYQAFTIMSKKEKGGESKSKVRILIVIDEASSLTKAGKEKEWDSSERILNVIVNEGRKFGVGLVLASQCFDHFTKDIRVNAACKLIHKVADLKEARAIASAIKVEAKHLMELRAPTQAVFYDGNTSNLVTLPLFQLAK